MFPNDFAPRVGHHLTFQVPANPKVTFDGLIVRFPGVVARLADRRHEGATMLARHGSTSAME